MPKRFFSYRQQHGLDIKVARIFNTYGPRMHPNDGRVVSNFIVQPLTGSPITIYGEGAQTRSFCFVSDLVEALLRLMETPHSSAVQSTLAIRVSSRSANLPPRLSRRPAQIPSSSTEPLPADDPQQRCPDISKAKGLLGWCPTIPLAKPGSNNRILSPHPKRLYTRGTVADTRILG